MDLLIISVSALAASCLTLFSGFGLGTLLTPVFALFFPIATAVAMTAVVHLANNLLKIGLVGRDAHWPTVIRFGLPAALAAVLGAFTLSLVSGLPPWFEYEFWGALRQVTPIKASVGMVIVVFALLELSPAFARLSFPLRWLTLGGLVSGFFGGLSGKQGAIRSAFLVKAGLSKEAYVGTGALCTVLVDVVRLAVYGSMLGTHLLMVERDRTGLAVLVATGSAFVGAYFGKRLLKKVTLRAVELAVATMMVLIGSGLASGLL
ncbi:MAG: sulfite exporter TauE/SafE family protein [Rhodoferax sp.]|nr:sulfite exporter TauE/SafE family protein [Rhodoferax sp.]